MTFSQLTETSAYRNVLHTMSRCVHPAAHDSYGHELEFVFATDWYFLSFHPDPLTPSLQLSIIYADSVLWSKSVLI